MALLVDGVADELGQNEGVVLEEITGLELEADAVHIFDGDFIVAGVPSQPWQVFSPAIGIAAGIVVTAPAATSQRADYGVESLAGDDRQGGGRIADRVRPGEPQRFFGHGPTALPYLKGLPLQSGRYVAKFEGRTIAEGGREVGRVVVSGSRGSGLAVSLITIAWKWAAARDTVRG